MKKIISFSLWGKIRLYCIGAIKNAFLAKIIFPGWICRYYYDNTVPFEVIDYLKQLNNTELVYIEKPSGGTAFKDDGQFGAFWRFYPLNDDDVEIFLIRDIDSRLSYYEYQEITEFMKSDNVIHSIRDNGEALCRGCGTSFRNFIHGKDTRIIGGVKLNIHEMIKNIDKDHCPFYTEENFLNDTLYPLYKNKFMQSSRSFDTRQPKYCGPFVGAVVGEDDKQFCKYTNKGFHNECNYSDLDVYMNEYISTIDILDTQ